MRGNLYGVFVWLVFFPALLKGRKHGHEIVTKWLPPEINVVSKNCSTKSAKYD